MPSSVLRLLQDRFGSERLNCGGYLFGLVAYDNESLLGSERRARSDNVLDERSSSGAVQNLRNARLQPRTFSRGKDDDRQIMIGHKASILASLARV